MAVVTNSVGRTVAAPPDPPPLGPRHARPAPARLSAARAAVLRMVAAADGPVTVGVLAEQLGQHPNTVREHLDALVAAGRATRLRSTPSGRGRPAWLYAAVRDHDGAIGRAADRLLGDAPMTGDGAEYIALAVALIDQVSDSSPDPRALARHAGERWGRTLAARHAAARTAVDFPTGDVERIATGDVSGAAAAPPNVPAVPIGSAAGTAGGTTADSAGPHAVHTVVEILRDLRFEPRVDRDPKTVRLTTCPFLDAARRHPDVVCQIHLGIVRGALEGLGSNPDGVDLRAFAEPGACLLNLPNAQ